MIYSFNDINPLKFKHTRGKEWAADIIIKPLPMVFLIKILTNYRFEGAEGQEALFEGPIDITELLRALEELSAVLSG